MPRSARRLPVLLAWPRIQPDGHGAANPAGLAFYDRLIDELSAPGIEPMATLYHWDLPQTLEGRRRLAEPRDHRRFGGYAALFAERFGGRVRTG